MEQIKNIIFDVGDVLLSYRWKYMLMDYGLTETEAVRIGMEMFDDPEGLWGLLDLGTVPQQEIIERYCRKYPADEKVKKKDADTTLQLERTEDILAFLGAHRREGQFICGFSMETENMLENSRAKLAKKNVDMIVANNLKVAGAGFGTDTNVVTLITKDDCRQLEIMSKADVAAAIVSEILQKMQ